MRQLATDSQLASGYLPMCLSGKRTLSFKALHKLLPHLKLRQQERRFLELLHLAGTTEEAQIRIQAIDDMGRMQEYRENNKREISVYKYLTSWHFVAIRELVTLIDFKADATWIQEKLGGRVPLAECEGALSFLLTNGFIEESNGKYFLPEKNLNCKDGIYKASLGEFHRQMLQLAGRSIESTPRAFRYILGHTFSVNIKDLDKVRAILEEAQDKLEKLSLTTKEPDHVYHVELASFPLTKVDATSKEGIE